MNAKELIETSKQVLEGDHLDIDNYVAAEKICEHILATVREDDDEPITETWLYEIGFQDDRAGTPTIGSLHIRPNNTPIYPAYACIRSLPIPVPKTRGQLRKLLEALGVK